MSHTHGMVVPFNRSMDPVFPPSGLFTGLVEPVAGNMTDPVFSHLALREIPKDLAAKTVIKNHYLHRKPPISFAFGLYYRGKLVGVCTFGTPPSRHLQKGVCPANPSLVIELNRLWVDDAMPRNTESWFVSRCLKYLPARIVVSYADTKYGHNGYMYRACNWHFGNLTDAERKTPRYDYIVPGMHTREAFRSGHGRKSMKVRRLPKWRYWIVTGNRREKRDLTRLCAWPIMDWHGVTLPPVTNEETA